MERIEVLPGLRGPVTGVHQGNVIGAALSGGDGPTWTVRVVSYGGSHRADIAQIIRTLQWQC